MVMEISRNEIDVENIQIYITYRSTNVILVTEENMDVKVDLSISEYNYVSGLISAIAILL
jgi:hypothetical protein